MTAQPHELGVAQAAGALAAGELSSVELVRALRAGIETAGGKGR